MAVMDYFKALQFDRKKTLKDFYDDLLIAYYRARPGASLKHMSYDIRAHMLQHLPEDMYAKVLNFAPGKSGVEIANRYDSMMAQLVSNNYVEQSATVRLAH